MTIPETNGLPEARLETALRTCSLVGPDAALRARILANAAQSRPRQISERLLPWAWTMLVIVLASAQWTERQTAERMARLAQRSAPVQFVQEEKAIRESPGWTAWILLPRAPMPLRDGYPSTRLHLSLGSLPRHWDESMESEGAPHVYLNHS